MSSRLPIAKKTPHAGTRRLMHLCLILAIVAAVVVGMGRLMNVPGVLLFTAKLIFLVAAVGAVFLPFTRRWLGEARTLGWVKNLILMIVALAVSMVLAELGIRALFAGITTTAEGDSYWARPWYATHVRLNHLGFREREFQVQKLSGVYRIAVVGDSFTFGQGIGETDRFTNRLERVLNRNGRQFEILNFGRPGADTIDEVEMLKDAVIGIQPDFVLLVWYVNDVEGHEHDMSIMPKILPLIPSSTLEPLLQRHSALYYFLKSEWGPLQQWLGWTVDYEYYMRTRFADPNSPQSRKATSQMRAFVATCRVHDIPMAIILFPDVIAIREHEYAFAFLHERVLGFCAQEGLPCIDLREPMARAAQHVNLMVNRFDGHPSAEANRIAAEEILKRFGPIWDPAATGRTGTQRKGGEE